MPYNPNSPTPIGDIVDDVEREVQRATSLHGSFHGAHEGHAVIREEFEELWDEVKKKHPDKIKMREEAIQIAAMAVRFIYDVCGG